MLLEVAAPVAVGPGHPGGGEVDLGPAVVEPAGGDEGHLGAVGLAFVGGPHRVGGGGDRQVGQPLHAERPHPFGHLVEVDAFLAVGRLEGFRPLLPGLVQLAHLPADLGGQLEPGELAAAVGPGRRRQG